jgi:formyl-CoA transferase
MDGRLIADKLLRAGVPAGPVLAVDEALAAPHTAARDMVTELDGYRGVATPIKLSRTPGGTRARPPRFSEHGEDVLAGHGFSREEIAALKERGVLRASRRQA